MKCPMCQQDQWIEGKLKATVTILFIPDHLKLVIPKYPALAAQACGSCGHVRISVDVEELKSATEE